jgi:hypothetical protein
MAVLRRFVFVLGLSWDGELEHRVLQLAPTPARHAGTLRSRRLVRA